MNLIVCLTKEILSMFVSATCNDGMNSNLETLSKFRFKMDESLGYLSAGKHFQL